MKKCISIILIAVLLVSLCACQGNFASVDLQQTIPIPDDGIISHDIVQKVKQENAIAAFEGTSEDFIYEWTLFGSDITQCKDVNLAVSIHQNTDEVQIHLSQNEAFGFSGLLSIHLNEHWSAQSATAYANNKAICSVSLTGSKHTILNLSLDGTQSDLTIRADESTEDTEIVTSLPVQNTETYLSAENSFESKVYSAEKESGVSLQISSQDANNAYLSGEKESESKVYSDGKDQYLTDPTPAGKPTPVEPEDQLVDKQTRYTCTFSIECSTILNNLDNLDPEKLEMIPSGGTILSATDVTFYEGESVFDVLQRVCRDNDIHMESSWTPIYNSAYIEGIHNLYEFDCGELSGWMYRVNGWYPNYGCSRYQLADGDIVEWRFTCDLGNDIGGGYAVGSQNER